MEVEEALRSRRSMRAYLPDPVSRETVTRILDLAARQASGTNLQPWNVYVVTGDAKQRITDEVLAVRHSGNDDHTGEFGFYPTEWKEPYLGRRRKVGFGLYDLVGIKKGETEKMMAQHDRNFMFFDAPVGLFFSVDKIMEYGIWLDYGMFAGSIMTAARAEGLHTCPQYAWSTYHKILRKHVAIPDDHTLICGMSMGVADLNAPENTLVTDRVPAVEFTKFYD